MKFKLIFTKYGAEIDSKKINFIHLVTKINSFFPMLDVNISEVDEKFWDDIKLGTECTFTYVEDDRNSDAQEYFIPFKVLSFQKREDIKKEIKLSLIHSLYFSDSLGSKAPYGSISDIFNNYCNKELTNIFLKSNIITTQDMPSIRYQLNKGSFAFLNDITKFGIFNQGPVYSFVDLKNTLNLLGVYQGRTMEPEYSLVPQSLKKDWYYSSDTTYPIIYTDSIQNCNGTNSSSKSIIEFSNMNFTTKYPMPIGKVYKNQEYFDYQSESFTPENYEYYDCMQNPADAYAVSIRELFEKNLETYSFNLKIEMDAFKYLKLGQFINVVSSNILDGKFLTETCLIWSLELLGKSYKNYIKLHLIPVSSNNKNNGNN